METYSKYLTIFVVIFFVFSAAGCRDIEIDKKNSEILSLQNDIKNQEGSRRAELTFLEEQLGVYQACIRFINICPKSIEEKAIALEKRGFTGSQSLWYYGILTIKLIFVALFLSIIIWCPHYLWLTYTKPLDIYIENANTIISAAEKNVKLAIARQLEAEGLTKIAEKRTADINYENKLINENLAAAQAALDAIKLEISTAAKHIERQKIIRESLKNL